MPKRVIDFDAMWGSDKLAACAAWAQAEYAWLYGLADASGCFELTNLRVIWGRVAAIRGNLTIERLEQIFAEFQDKGLLFVWVHEGKRYAHWTGSDVPGRLPPPSWRMRLERFAPPVPKQQLAEYMAGFARGRAALAGVGFSGEAHRESSDRKEDRRFEISNLKDKHGPGELFGNSHLRERQAAAGVAGRDEMARESRHFTAESGLKERLEGTQVQDLGLVWNLDGNWGMGRDERRGGPGAAQGCSGDANRKKNLTQTDFCNSNSHSNSNAQSNANADANSTANTNAYASSPSNVNPDPKVASPADLSSHSRMQPHMDSPLQSRSTSGGSSHAGAAAEKPEGAHDWKDRSRGELRAGSEPARSAASFALRDKELAVARELRVGQGPVCGPARVRPEVLERVRRRDAARAGSRSP